jgi:hypothetical protein
MALYQYLDVLPVEELHTLDYVSPETDADPTAIVSFD